MTPNDSVKAEGLLRRWGHMMAVRSPWQTLWQQLAEYVMPRKFGGMPSTAPGTAREARLFDTTTIHANTVLANGQLTWAHGDNWFSFSPPARLKRSEAAKQWFAECTEIIRDILANSSNFYTQVHEFYLDRSCFGTAALYVEPGKKYALNFRTFPLGSFCIDEDDEGVVDTVFRELELTARQAEQRFGRDNLPNKILECLTSPDAAKQDTKFKFVHCIYPRQSEEINPDIGPMGMPIASVYVECSEKSIVFESGYMETPVFVSRYLEWNNGLGGIYGWCPAWAALPEAKQLNLLQMWMDALAEKAAFPPILKPASMEGEIDLSAGAINEFDDSLGGNAAMPKEFGTAGEYKLGLDRIRERQGAVRRHFHVDLFQMFSRDDGKNITATFVNAKMREQVAQISPSFTRLKMELHGPLLQRVFSLCLELGYLPEPPKEIIEQVSETLGAVASPAIQYQSRFDIELRSMNGGAMETALMQLQGLATFDPSVVDNIKLDEPARDVFTQNGLPADYLRPVTERDAIRQQRMQVQQQAQQAALAEQMGKAAGNVAKVDPEKLKQLAEVAS